MNMSQLKRTIRMDFRRGIRILPATAIYTLIFLLVSLVVIRNGEKLFFNPNQSAQVPVGLCMPMNNEGNSSGFALVENMQSFRETLQIIQYDDEAAGAKALENKEITALIIIPEDFVDAISRDENLPVRIIFKDNNTMEEHIVNDLLLSSAQMLGTAQATQFTLERLISDHDVDPAAGKALISDINTTNLTQVLTRDNLYTTEQFDQLARLPLTSQLASCYSLLVISLLSFILTPFYQGRKNAYVIRQHAAGLGRAGIRLSEWITTVFLLYSSYLIIFVSLKLAGFGPKWISLLGMLPVLMLVGMFIHLLAYAVKNSAYANLVILIGIVLLMYLSGGLIPMELLPKFLQKLSNVNPIYGLIRMMQAVMY